MAKDGPHGPHGQERLREFFSSCGDIRHAHLAVERSGRSRGFGKVVFLDENFSSAGHNCRDL